MASEQGRKEKRTPGNRGNRVQRRIETKERNPNNAATHLGPKSNLSSWWGCRTGGPGGDDGRKSRNAFDPIRMFSSASPVCKCSSP